MGTIARRVVIVAVLAGLAAGCDIETAVLKLFEDQGLHLLKPARSYIEVGGLVVVPKNGKPVYIDRLDAIPANATEPPAVTFSAVVLKESKGKSMDLGTTLAAIQGVLPVSLAAGFNKSQQVELAQINASGERLRFPTLASLIQARETRKLLTSELQRKGRAFVVWEVYRSTGLSVKGSGNVGLDVGIALGQSSPAVGATTTAAASAAAPTASPSPVTSPASPSPTPSPSPSASPTASPSPGAKKDEPFSATWKRTTTYELSLNVTTPIPIAVRLAEVVLTPAGTLELRPGAFKFKGTLGAPTDVERYTGSLDDRSLALERVRVEELE